MTTNTDYQQALELIAAKEAELLNTLAILVNTAEGDIADCIQGLTELNESIVPLHRTIGSNAELVMRALSNVQSSRMQVAYIATEINNKLNPPVMPAPMPMPMP